MPSGQHSAKFEFFLKNLCRVPWSWHLAKPEKWFSEHPFFQLCRLLWEWHSAKWPKTTIFNFVLHSIVTNKFIQTYITYISHPSAHITSITIYITYIIISAQIHPNKSTSPSQVHQSPQVHHKYITSSSPSEQQMKKYNLHSSRPCDCGEGSAPSFGGAWGGLFEPPSDGDYTKEKRLYVRQDYFNS